MGNLFCKAKPKSEPETEPDIPKPKIDPQFWYDLSPTMIEGSIGRLDAGIDSINKLIVAIYGFYTAANLVSLTFANSTYLELGILALPYILLPIAQWKTVVSSAPASEDFSPDSDSSIKDAYQRMYKEKDRQLTFLKKLSFWAIFFTGIALTSAFIISKQPAKVPYICIKQTTNQNSHSIYVAGYINGNDSRLYRIIIAQHWPVKNRVDSAKVLFDKTYLNTESGEFQYSISADTTGQYYTTTLEWNQKGTRSIRQSTQKTKDK